MTSHTTNALLEDINAKFDVILEIVRPLAELPERVGWLEDDVRELKEDMKVVKVAVTDTNRQIQKHEAIFQGFTCSLTTANSPHDSD